MPNVDERYPLVPSFDYIFLLLKTIVNRLVPVDEMKQSVKIPYLDQTNLFFNYTEV